MDTIKSMNTSSADSDSSGCPDCWLSNFSAFKNCTPELQHKILSNKEEKTYNKGEFLIKNGDKVAGVFFIQKGFVKIFKKGIRKKEFIMWVAGQGDIVGLNSFINDELYSFSASAIGEAHACFIPTSDLQILLSKEPAAFIQLMGNLCKKINLVEQRITSISKKSIREQCAELLISIAVQNNPETDKKLIVNYSVKDLASLVGTTKNYLYKVLLEFTDKEILSVTNRKLVINNMNALTLIATGND